MICISKMLLFLIIIILRIKIKIMVNEDHFSSYYRNIDGLNFLVNNCWPSNNSLSACHSIEITSTPMSISSHSIKAEPITNLSINWDINTFSDDIHSITSHSKQSRISSLKNSTWLSLFINLWIKLISWIFKWHTIH